jgi:hypoxanthine-DNA glycosylase
MHDSPLKHFGFAPVINAQTHTLILGSFPGAASLQAQQYYAFKHNQFWPLMSAVLGCDLVGLAYTERLKMILDHGIGLWDVYAACMREGSLDAAIRQGELNDFSDLKTRYPALRQLCFNGQTSGKLAKQFAQQGFTTLVLPSSSPAHASLRFEQKLELWQKILTISATFPTATLPT